MLNEIKSKIFELEKEIKADIIFYLGDIIKNISDKDNELNDEDIKILHSKCQIQKPDDKVYLVLQTQGGPLDAGFNLIDFLKSKYSEVNVIIYSCAKSIGTVVALSADNLFMGDNAAISDIKAQYDFRISSGTLEDALLEFNALNTEYINCALDKFEKGKVVDTHDATEMGLLINNLWATTNAHGTSILYPDAKKIIKKIQNSDSLPFNHELLSIFDHVASIQAVFKIKRFMFFMNESRTVT